MHFKPPGSKKSRKSHLLLIEFQIIGLSSGKTFDKPETENNPLLQNRSTITKTQVWPALILYQGGCEY
jgi:hypothetical protein